MRFILFVLSLVQQSKQMLSEERKEAGVTQETHLMSPERWDTPSRGGSSQVSQEGKT